MTFTAPYKVQVLLLAYLSVFRLIIIRHVVLHVGELCPLGCFQGMAAEVSRYSCTVLT